MNNKFNLNYYETMENANEYLDMLEDNLEKMKEELNPEELENVLSLMMGDEETALQLDDMLFMHLEQNDYQNVCNQLIINEMFNMLINTALPKDDLSYIGDYLESITEDQLIEDVTEFIENYNNWEE